MKRILLIAPILVSLFNLQLAAQDLTGIWRGYFITDDYQQYRFEIQMEQTRNNMLSGVTYSYLDKRFYGKSSMTGTFTVSSGNALIQEIKTLEVKMSSNSMTCIQKFRLTYVKSGREEFLEGSFSSIIEKTDTALGYRRGDNCGSGTMYLRKVTTSDFYVEPFLRNRPSPNVRPPLVKNNPPQNNRPVSKNPSTNSSTKNSDNSTITIKPNRDTISKKETELVSPENNITAKSKISPPEILKTRENSLVQTLYISSPNVTIKIYDNGEIDDDTVSVYLDNELVLSKKRLTRTALTLNLKLDESNPEHELVMVAENLGRIPPNTSLMIVTAGEQRYEVRITSTEQKNALVRFKYRKP